MDATARLLAMIVLASFAIERVLAAVSYLFSADRLRRLRHPRAAKIRARERRKLVMFVLAAVIAWIAVDLTGIRIIRLLDPALDRPRVDFFVTWLVLLAGADRARSLLREAKGERETPAVRVHVS